MDVGVQSSNDIYDPMGAGGLVTLGVRQNRRRKVVTVSIRLSALASYHIVGLITA
jgi:hypothetical protein